MTTGNCISCICLGAGGAMTAVVCIFIILPQQFCLVEHYQPNRSTIWLDNDYCLVLSWIREPIQELDNKQA